MNYVAPRWLPGGHLQTIWPALYGRRGPGAPPVYRRERWDTADGDFVDLDFAAAPGRQAGAPGDTRPLLVLFHGLEGSSRSHYAEAFAGVAAAHGWDYVVPHFRGCGGSLNRAPRAYHSGDFGEIGWILERLRAGRSQPLRVVGVSLGGNALLRWAQEAGEGAARTVAAVASICAPLDLAAGAAAIGRGFGRHVYTRMFLASMKPKALAKLAQHPGLFDGEALRAARDLHAFDDVFTAPLHGFRDAEDYWRRCSAGPHLGAIRVPALVLNTANDPFVPAASLPAPPQEAQAPVTLWRPATGGHVGFPAGAPPGHVRAMPEAVGGWLASVTGLQPSDTARPGPAAHNGPMDDIVKQAIAKWPSVPDCYGWLGLDARGQWFMRDDAAQAAGPFAGPGATEASRGSLLRHEKLVDFIQRNYEADAQGRWFFQNGPQRVYVELAITPYIWRVSDGLEVHAHTGTPARVQRCLVDEQGRVYLDTHIGFGLVHSLDMVRVGDAVEQGIWVPQEVPSSDLPQRFGYIPSPAEQPAPKRAGLSA